MANLAKALYEKVKVSLICATELSLFLPAASVPGYLNR